MPAIISDTKLVYPEFKFFKSLYTSLNICSKIYLYLDKRDDTKFLEEVNEETSKILIGFESDSPYYQLQGEISGNTEFFKWLKTVNIVSLTLTEINTLSKCLKKNAISVEYEDGNFFRFNYLNKETNANEYIEIKESNSVEWFFEKYSMEKFVLNKEFNLNDSFLKSEICNIFRDSNGDLCQERTKDKILEIPTARIKSLLKNSSNKLSLSERDSDGARFVAIKSYSNELNLSITQTFKTI